MPPITIDSADDPRIADYRDIRERDLAGHRGLFVAEGKVVLDAMLEAGRFAPVSALVLDRRLEGLRPVLAKAPPGMPVYVAGGTVMDAIAGFPIHRGILALGRRPAPADPAALLRSLPPRAKILVLVGISNHDNVGALFRNAAAFGVDAVFLDPTCCDPLYRKAIRVSVGAALRVPFAMFEDAPILLDAVEAAGFAVLALSPSGERELRTITPPPRLAVMVGTEGLGLPKTLLARTRTVRIAMAPGFDSLNVATAAALALHWLTERVS